jgi:hypothetical protein
MTEGGGHRRREAWGVGGLFVPLRCAPLHKKAPHASGFWKGILIVVQEKE